MSTAQIIEDPVSDLVLEAPKNESELDPIKNVRQSLSRATNYAFNRQNPDGHWCGEIKHDATFTAEVIMLRQAVGLDMSHDRTDLISWFLSEQNADGSWSWAPGLPGDISPSVEAYFALKLLGLQPDSMAMSRARTFIQHSGGIVKVRIFTRIWLAQFGLFPWSCVPELPAELILLPSLGPIHVYQLAVWARLAVVPLLVVCHHRPIFALPNGRSESNDYLDELWCNPAEKNIPYSEGFWNLLRTDFTGSLILAADKALSLLGGLRRSPTRQYALNQCIKWILDRQEGSGDIGGTSPGMKYSILALHLEGYALDSHPVKSALQALERFNWRDVRGKRYQSCKGPVWDTVLMTIALSNAGVEQSKLSDTVNWIKAQQSLNPNADWRVARPRTKPGGYGFFYNVSWYPDTDDTSAAIVALIKADPALRSSDSVLKAVEWLLGMQNPDGGWGAFDADSDYVAWNKVPFSDMDALCDPSSADVTGRILEALALVLDDLPDCLSGDLVWRMMLSSERAISYLQEAQEASGAWYGRWGANYIYGTGNALKGLAGIRKHQGKHQPEIQRMVRCGVSWLKAQQNPDGGWGESVESYNDASLAGQGPSTPSQTAWAVLGLLEHCDVHLRAIGDGIEFLLQTQTESDEEGAAHWASTYWTGTAFPGSMYLGYVLYDHYFPVMALGRYLKGLRED